jgi:anti-anti-sigma factor
MADAFPMQIEKDTVKITLTGKVDSTNAGALGDQLRGLVGKQIAKVVFLAGGLDYIASAGLRAIVFAKQKLGAGVTVFLIAPKPDVLDVFKMTGFDTYVTVQDTFKG